MSARIVNNRLVIFIGQFGGNKRVGGGGGAVEGCNFHSLHVSAFVPLRRMAKEWPRARNRKYLDTVCT